MKSWRHFFLLPLALLLVLTVSCEQRRVSRLKVGDQAPAFELADLEGNLVSLAAYQGSPVVLRFWSTDCKYCRADTPVFNDYFTKYKVKGLKVVYINTLDRGGEEVRAFVEDLDIVFPVVLDRDGRVAASYNVRVVPQTIIMDPQHRIVAGILGGVSEAELQELLQPYL